jgi:hypothetical protein
MNSFKANKKDIDLKALIVYLILFYIDWKEL